MCLGIPGQISAITDAKRSLAKVNIGGVLREVNIACIVEEGMDLSSYIGAWVLVHVGFAMSRIDEEEAQRTLQILEELGEMQQELATMQESEVRV